MGQSSALRWYMLFLCVAFVGTLAAVIGGRVAAERGAFLVGMACGIGASVPASLLAVYLGRQAGSGGRNTPAEKTAYPPLVILNASAAAPTPAPRTPLPELPVLGPAGAPDAARPRYRVIGDE